MPEFLIVLIASGFTSFPGSVPAEQTIRFLSKDCNQPCAIWLRQLLPVHNINIFTFGNVYVFQKNKVMYLSPYFFSRSSILFKRTSIRREFDLTNSRRSSLLSTFTMLLSRVIHTRPWSLG